MAQCLLLNELDKPVHNIKWLSYANLYAKTYRDVSYDTKSLDGNIKKFPCIAMKPLEGEFKIYLLRIIFQRILLRS